MNRKSSNYTFASGIFTGFAIDSIRDDWRLAAFCFVAALACSVGAIVADWKPTPTPEAPASTNGET